MSALAGKKGVNFGIENRDSIAVGCEGDARE